MLPAPGDEVTLGLFPLPSTVLFPGVPLPLHVFEPRYRALTRDALAGGRRIGMVLLRPGWEGDYEGRPPVHEVGCLGTIAREEAREDGRFDLLLVGGRRFRILEELPGGEYRRARVRILGEEGPDPEDPSSVAMGAALVDAVETLRPGALRASGAVAPDLAPLVGVAATACEVEPADRQALLELDDAGSRARLLLSLLAPRAARARALDRLMERGAGDPEAN